jgi:hypothetical protein
VASSSHALESRNHLEESSSHVVKSSSHVAVSTRIKQVFYVFLEGFSRFFSVLESK